jgi:photosystem II stability/assembly factor-like uncharacterized protein
MKKIVLVFSLLLILPLDIFSQQNFWEQTSGPFGGYINSILSNSNQEIFVLTSSAIYKTSNLGTNWFKVRQGGYSRSLITPQNNLVIANSRNVYLSTNGGNDWQQIYLAIEDITAIGTDLNGDIFVATNRTGINFSFTKIFKTADHGLNWNEVYSSSEGLTSFEYSNNNIYVGYANGILKSTNGGLSWSHINISGGSNCFDLEVDVLNNIFFIGGGGVFKSTNDGDTWEYLGFDDLLPLSIESDSDQYIYLGTQNGVYISSDQGQSWYESSDGIQNQVIFSLKKISNGELLCGTGGAGIYLSINNGESWNQIGLPEIRIQTLFVNSQNIIYSGTQSAGIFKSTDKGDYWIGSGLAGMKINTIAVNSNNIMYAGGEPMTIANNKHLFFSSDSGINWSPLDHPYVRINKILVTSQNIVFTATAGGGVYRSINNGLTWEQKNSGLTGSHIKSIALNSNYEIFAGTDYYGICKSTNNGNIWQQIGLPDYSINDIEINSVGEIYVSTYKHYQTFEIYKSTDDGVTWAKFNSGIPNVPVSTLTKNDNDDIFAGTESDGVYILKKDSIIWSPANSGLTNLTISDLLIDLDGFVYAGTNGSGVFISYNSTTGLQEETNIVPTSEALLSNYPNPFNPLTIIGFRLSRASNITLKIFDLLGNEISTLIDEYRIAGTHEFEFNASGLTSGVYFYQLKAGDYADTKKMILLK